MKNTAAIIGTPIKAFLPVRSLIRLLGELMSKADYECEMNHAFDFGEWSSEFDIDIYEGYVNQFKSIVEKYGWNLDDFMEEIDRYDRQSKQWYDTNYNYWYVKFVLTK